MLESSASNQDVRRSTIAVYRRSHAQREELLRNEVDLPLRRQAGLNYFSASHNLYIAFARYALGDPAAEVRSELLSSGKYMLRVFELRKPWEEGMNGALHPIRGGEDYSLTNSKNNLFWVCIALAAGDNETATQLSQLAWDPSKAFYITQRSQTCRPYDPPLAQAMKCLLSGNVDEIESVLAKAKIPPRETRAIEVREIMFALARDDKESFLEAIDRLLEWHGKATATRWPHEMITHAHKDLCLWALGYLVLAIQRDLIQIQDVPAGYAYLPLKLVQLALD